MLEGLSAHKGNEGWDAMVSLESAFPMGTTAVAVDARRDIVRFTTKNGSTVTLGEYTENGVKKYLPQDFLTTDLSSEDENTHAVDHIILFSTLTKRYRVRLIDEVGTTEARKKLLESAMQALREGIIDNASYVAQCASADAHVKYTTSLRPRDRFSEKFYSVMNDWDGKLHPELAVKGYKAGRTHGDQRDRLLALLDGDKLIAIREIATDVFVDASPEETTPAPGFDVVDFHGKVSQGQWLTHFALLSDWEDYKKELAKLSHLRTRFHRIFLVKQNAVTLSYELQNYAC